tara:strand:+ start:388 stop:1077 length:690 start_codon:yes stop_codon:yes gene_type:complete
MMPDLMLIGTAHVIDLSLPLERHIKNFSPDLIALELDKQRWYALKTQSQRTEGPFYLRLLSRLQKYLGDSFGSSPGAEMMVATNIANTIGAKLAFIDKPILQTINGAWKNMPWNEFSGIIKDSMISFVGGGSVNIEDSMKTGDFSDELEQFALQYPSLKKELIDNRDVYMSTNIVKLFRSQRCERMVAVVGEGHVSGMAEKLLGLNPKVVRLSDLLQNNESSISFSIEI